MYVLNTTPPSAISADQEETLRRLMSETLETGNVPGDAGVRLPEFLGPDAPEPVRGLLRAAFDEALERSGGARSADDRAIALDEILDTVIVNDEDVDVYRQ